MKNKDFFIKKEWYNVPLVPLVHGIEHTAQPLSKALQKMPMLSHYCRFTVISMMVVFSHLEKVKKKITSMIIDQYQVQLL